jgi:hypothetical protein
MSELRKAVEGAALSAEQAHEAAYRFVAGYYDFRRITPVMQLLDALAWSRAHPDSNEAGWPSWHACVVATLEGAPLPNLRAPWDE